MKRIYLSGPMSGLPEHNFPAFNAEAARLRALGYDVVNPVDINPDPGKSWHECLRADLAALLTCDTLALLPGWQGSTGAHLEMHVAHRIAMPIVIAAEVGSVAKTASADAFPQAHRLALELECLLLSTKDIAAVSKWWDSATDALDQWREFCRESAAEFAAPDTWRVGDPTVDQVHLDDVKRVLRDLVATIDLHTDCMSNKIDREALDPWIERAEDLLGQTLEEIAP